jgi:hypothetical protein
MLDCAGCIETQRLTCAAGVVVAARAAGLPLGSVVVGDGLGLFAALVVVEDALDVVFVGVGVGVGVLVAVAVLLAVFAGVAVDFADALAVVVDVVGFADGELLDDFRVWVVVLVGELLVGGSVVGALVDGVGLGEGLVEVAVGVGVGVALGDGVAACTGSHCCTVPLLAAATARIRPAG